LQTQDIVTLEAAILRQHADKIAKRGDDAPGPTLDEYDSRSAPGPDAHLRKQRRVRPGEEFLQEVHATVTAIRRGEKPRFEASS
jgi:hypothetical protein